MKKPTQKLDPKKIRFLSEDEKNRLVNDRLNVFFKFTIDDLMSFFDLVNTISIGSDLFVTNNHLILEIRNKLCARIMNLRIMSVKEFEEYLVKNKLKPETRQANYVG